MQTTNACLSLSGFEKQPALLAQHAAALRPGSRPGYAKIWEQACHFMPEFCFPFIVALQLEAQNVK
jgi:hypothetical protein